jgi:hypothetical protein
MTQWILNELSFVANRTIDFSRGHYIFLRATVTQDRSALMEEIKDPVMHIPMAGA